MSVVDIRLQRTRAHSPFPAFPPPNGKNDDGSPLNRPQEFNGTLPGEEHIDKNAFDHPATYEVSSAFELPLYEC